MSCKNKNACLNNIIFISNLDIFSLISPSDIVGIKEMTRILKIIGQCDVKHIMTVPIKAITLVLNV